MPKSTIEYWNPLIQTDKNLWKPIPGLEEMVEELTLSIDTKTGEYTRLTRFILVLIRLILVPKVIIILKKFSSSVVVYSIHPSIYG
jgi:flagellar biosynthesis protein FliP